MIISKHLVSVVPRPWTQTSQLAPLYEMLTASWWEFDILLYEILTSLLMLQAFPASSLSPYEETCLGLRLTFHFSVYSRY